MCAKTGALGTLAPIAREKPKPRSFHPLPLTAIDTSKRAGLDSAPANMDRRGGKNTVDELWLALVRGERRGPLAATARLGLRLASWPYGLAMRARNALFQRGWKPIHRAGVPVVSVGNLTLGGTGKTPCVEYVARFYRGPERSGGDPEPRLRRARRAATTRRWSWRRTCPTCRTCKGPTASPLARDGGRGAGERGAGARRRLPAPPAAPRPGRGADRRDRPADARTTCSRAACCAKPASSLRRAGRDRC